MNKKSEIILLIKEYQNHIKAIADCFYNEFGSPLRVRGWSSGKYSKSSSIPGIESYNFHGAGLWAVKGNVEVDFDFGPNGRVDGFDAFRLFEFLKSSKFQSKSLWTVDSIQNLINALEKDGIIFKPGWLPGTANYYFN